MSKETTAEIFIRLLVEALETDRVIRRHDYALRSRYFAKRYRKTARDIAAPIEPQDCVQLMSDVPNAGRTG